MIFVTSDTHFGHERIIDLCNRPYDSVNEMNEALIENWNSVVSDDDTVIHLGDVALGPWVEWDGILTRLNGYKILVVGNHDRVFKGMSSKEQAKFKDHYEGWFDEVHDSLINHHFAGRDFNFSHFPYDGDSHGGDRYREHRLPDDGWPLIHGHTHEDRILTTSQGGTQQIHVGVDAWNYTPVSEDQIDALLRGVE